MSVIIELDSQPAAQFPDHIKQVLRSVFKSSEFVCRNVVDEGREIIFYIKGSKTTYRLTTVWKFNLGGDQFNLNIMFYNTAEDDLLRGCTDRMKIELSILTRMINDQVMPTFSFLVDNQSGVLRLVYSVAWPNFHHISSKRQNVYALIMNLFLQMRRYDQLMLFVEPMLNVREVKKQADPHVRINKFRMVLKNTRNTRLQFQACIGDLLRLKEMNKELYRDQIDQIGSLYMRNIVAFQKSTIGLEDADEFEVDPKQYAHELKEVRKNETGFTNYQKGQSTGSKSNMDKILYGLLKIQPDKQGNEKLLSQEGAHSQIYKKNFRYIIADTIYAGTINMDQQQWMERRKELRGELTYKTCNTKAETSINSFKNEIDAITYMKDMTSPFIARYYLLIKQSWDETDTIYMNNYKQNVYHLLKAHKTFSVKMRLELAYKIAKGLCFLYSKEILHRDFKPQNVVVDSNLVPKILDFGSSVSHFMKRSFKSHDERLLTTPGFHIQHHQLPQGYEYLKQKYTKRQYDQHPLFDVYGFGRTLCFIFFGSLYPPHPETLVSEPMFQVLENVIFLIQMCLNVDPDDRPGFGELTSFLGILKQLIKNIITEEEQQQIFAEETSKNQ